MFNMPESLLQNYLNVDSSNIHKQTNTTDKDNNLRNYAGFVSKKLPFYSRN